MREDRGPADRERMDHPGTHPAAVWFGILGGGAAWIIHLGASFWSIPWICAREAEWGLHAITAGTLLLAAAATGVSWKAMRKSGGFLPLSGLFLSGFFLVVILVEGMPALLQSDPCGEIPSFDRPIILLDREVLYAALLMIGGPVGPEGIWSAWHGDPWILVPVYLFTATYLLGVRRAWAAAGRGRGIAPWRVGAYLGGMAAIVLALLSPIDAASRSLFSVHMVQHMLLMVVAAPLLILGRPMLGYLWALPDEARRRVGREWHRMRAGRSIWRAISHPAIIFVVHVAALWIWHHPRLYQAALADPWIHHLEHASFFFSAMLFWWALSEVAARGRWPGYAAGILYVFATALQSGALGALMLFAGSPWYPAHAPGTALWGWDLLVDQQVAGAIMWIPAGLVYAGAAVLLLIAWIRKSEEAVIRRERAGWGTLRAER